MRAARNCHRHSSTPTSSPLLAVIVLLAAALPNVVRAVESPTDPKLQYKVNCDDDYMTVDIKKTDDIKSIYLNQLKFYPELACQPVFEKNLIRFRVSLRDVYKCGLTKATNQGTGTVTYYHQIVIEKDGGPDVELKSFVNVKCWFSGNVNHTVTKRNVLPAGFQEQEDLEISGPVEGKAPVPMLKVGVRQGGSIVNGELNVNPGTPLQMEIYLDKESAMLYGLLVSYMQVTDTKSQEETIIFNGCSVDPYLFENFNTVDGDFLTAKFRAFKFPESTYVQFKGTVNVCLDKCRGVDCSNGKVGFGRRKREISGIPPDPNKIFEVSMTTFIKVDYKNEVSREKVNLEVGSTDERNRTGGDDNLYTKSEGGAPNADGNDRMRVDTEEIREELKYTLLDDGSAGHRPGPSALAAVVAASVSLLLVNVYRTAGV